MDKNLLMLAIPQNLAPAKQELTPSKTGEIELFESLKGKTILNSPVTNLKEVLRLCMLKVGLRANNLPNEEEKAVLIEHIYKEYGNHTIMEIKLAFDMAIAGKLNLEKNEVTCYENFSCLYFSGIMNAYREWSKEAVNFVPNLIKQKVFTQTQIDDERRADVEACFKAIKKGYSPIIHDYFNEILIKDNLLSKLFMHLKYVPLLPRYETPKEFFVRKLNTRAENIYVKDETKK